MSFNLWLGDCLGDHGLSSLPDLSVDHLITDPPYSTHVDGNSIRGNGHKAGGKKKALGFDPITVEQMEALADECARLVRRWVIVFSDIESSHLWRGAMTSAGLEFIRTGIWVKENSTPQFSGDRPAAGCEAITICHREGKKQWNGGGRPATWRFPTAYRDGDDVRHTTQKPLSLMQKLVEDFTCVGETIVDPFAGSGTTGSAALSLGRNFIGWEKDAKYQALATNRLLATKEQLTMFGGTQCAV